MGGCGCVCKKKVGVYIAIAVLGRFRHRMSVGWVEVNAGMVVMVVMVGFTNRCVENICQAK